jgi:hypothetical protein
MNELARAIRKLFAGALLALVLPVAAEAAAIAIAVTTSAAIGAIQRRVFICRQLLSTLELSI